MNEECGTGTNRFSTEIEDQGNGKELSHIAGFSVLISYDFGADFPELPLLILVEADHPLYFVFIL